jgi:hypothetical protein
MSRKQSKIRFRSNRRHKIDKDCQLPAQAQRSFLSPSRGAPTRPEGHHHHSAGSPEMASTTRPIPSRIKKTPTHRFQIGAFEPQDRTLRNPKNRANEKRKPYRSAAGTLTGRCSAVSRQPDVARRLGGFLEVVVNAMLGDAELRRPGVRDGRQRVGAYPQSISLPLAKVVTHRTSHVFESNIDPNRTHHGDPL